LLGLKAMKIQEDIGIRLAGTIETTAGLILNALEMRRDIN
jgi:hypothetical protein